MAITVSQVYNSFARLKKDISDVPLATFYEWCDWTNKMLYRKMTATDGERYTTQQTYTSPSTGSYALPVDFSTIDGFNCGIYRVDGNGDMSGYTLFPAQPGSSVAGWYIRGSLIYFTGLSGESSYVMRYLPAPVAIDGLTDYFTQDTTQNGKATVDDEFLQHLVGAIDVLYDQWDEDTGAEIYADQRFARLLDDLVLNMKREPAVYGLPDSSLMY